MSALDRFLARLASLENRAPRVAKADLKDIIKRVSDEEGMAPMFDEDAFGIWTPKNKVLVRSQADEIGGYPLRQEHQWESIHPDQGRQMGFFQTKMYAEPPLATISGSFLGDAFKGRGHGKDAYNALTDFYGNLGSDYVVSSDARRVWDRLKAPPMSESEASILKEIMNTPMHLSAMDKTTTPRYLWRDSREFEALQRFIEEYRKLRGRR